ncbi:hypothetical protein KUTeg_014278 [Tegillarca granosa]|uniref:Uncharacterized protein n=1 Tax=Tegillarca granosa TaxID=220873 RepID=A0ABQ9EWI1_TEGGR|nr:hypothetical protein KUTeg_014278 [Tegillarca granosa]
MNKSFSMTMPPEKTSEKHFKNEHLGNKYLNDDTNIYNREILLKENIEATQTTNGPAKITGSSNSSEREISTKNNVKAQDDEIQQNVKVTSNNTEIVSKFVHCRKVDHIAALNNTCAWIAGSGYLDLVSTNGKILRSIKINFPVRGMTITKDGKLLLSTEGRIKQLLDTGEVTDLVQVGRFNANGIYVSDRNEVLVCLYKDDVGELIRRLTPEGQTIQTISHDKNGSQLFAWPWYIAETKEGDIWVSDYTEECIIVINNKSEPKFKYNGPSHIKMDKQFYPRGMISNRLGQIVVIDRGNEAVHLVDKDGHFVKFILTKDDGLNGPYSLSQDNEGTIWVGCASRKIVIIAKYLKP